MRIKDTLLAKSKNRFFLKYEKSYLLKCFDNINDLPIHNWWRYHETGDVSFALKERTYFGKREKIILSSLWERLSDEYVNKYGLGEAFLSILNKQKEIALLKLQWIADGDNTLLTEIEILEEELKNITSKKDIDILEYKAIVEDKTGHQIDIRKTSVTEFKAYESLMQKKHGDNGGK